MHVKLQYQIIQDSSSYRELIYTQTYMFTKLNQARYN